MTKNKSVSRCIGLMLMLTSGMTVYALDDVPLGEQLVGRKAAFGLRIVLANGYWIENQQERTVPEQLTGIAVRGPANSKSKAKKWSAKEISNRGQTNVKMLVFTPGEQKTGVVRGELVQFPENSFRRNDHSRNPSNSVDAELILFDPMTAQVLSRVKTKLGAQAAGFKVMVGKGAAIGQ